MVLKSSPVIGMENGINQAPCRIEFLLGITGDMFAGRGRVHDRFISINPVLPVIRVIGEQAIFFFTFQKGIFCPGKFRYIDETFKEVRAVLKSDRYYRFNDRAFLPICPQQDFF